MWQAHDFRHGGKKVTLLIIPTVPNTPDLVFLLHDLARQLRVAGDRRARAHGMTRAQWVILWWLERQPGLSQKELAALMDVEPITVARLVDRLAARGMVERRDDPADRRIWRLHLLPPAMPVLDHMRGVRDEFQRILAGDVPAETLSDLAHALATMKANLTDELRTRPDRPTETVAEPSPKPRAPVRRRGPAAPRAGSAPEPVFHQDPP